MAFNALFLHGLMQNAKMVEKDFAHMSSRLSKFLKVSYLDAPYFLQSYPVFCQVSDDKSDDELRMMTEKFRENHYKKNGKMEHYQRTWFFTESPGDYHPQFKNVEVLGLEKSLDLVLNECKKTKCDGLVGFSQGCIVSTLLAKKAMEDPSLGWKPKFCLLFSGPMPYCLPLTQTLSSGSPLDLPSLHVMGRKDKIVPNHRSLMLSECYQNPKLHYHDGAHTLPDNDDLSVYEKFLSQL